MPPVIDSLGICGVFLTKPPMSPFLHCGFWYVIDSQKLLFHLKWHHKLIREADDGSQSLYFPLIGFEPEELVYFTGFMKKIDEQMPYGLSADGLIFDRNTSKLINTSDGRGFTCASFIISVIESGFNGVSLLHQNEWPLDRPEDLKFQIWVCSELRRRGQNLYADLVAKDVGCARFQPAEVVFAASTNSMKWPVSFEKARRKAHLIEARLQ